MPPFTQNLSAVPNKFIGIADLTQVLSDALLSFSPLATLVGANSARAFAHRATNFKQNLAISLAPIGALGMMATACKGTNISGLKEMLGVGEDDIFDAAREVGCGVAKGGALPMMDKNGGLMCTVKGGSYDEAAHAIVRLKWVLGDDRSLDFNALRWIADNFVAVTISGRVCWDLTSDEARNMIPKIRTILLSSWAGMAVDAFADTHNIQRGSGVIEISWPAPAMPLETHSFVIYAYIATFLLGFLSVTYLAASPFLLWQTPLSSALLIGGQLLLVAGHCAIPLGIQYQRKNFKVSIATYQPTDEPNAPQSAQRGVTPITDWNQWVLVNKPRFSSFVARRPLRPSKHPPNHVTLSQHFEFKQRHVRPTHTLVALLAVCVGFIAFYIGGKTSNFRTILIYIGLFILANMTKGSTILRANKPIHTRLHNIELPRVADFDLPGQDMAKPEGGRTPGSRPDINRGDPATNVPSNGFRIYSKFLARSRNAVDLFCFSSADEWVMAAHVISKTVGSLQASQPGWGVSEALLQIPLYRLPQNGAEGGRPEFVALLLMAIDNIEPKNLFWSVGAEVATILTDNHTSPMLASETKKMETSILAAFVYSCTRMLLSDEPDCGDVKLDGQQWGAKRLLHAIHETTREFSNTQREEPSLSFVLHTAARKAGLAKGIRSKVNIEENEAVEKANLFNQHIKPKMKKLDDLLREVEHFTQAMMPEGLKPADLFQPSWAEDLKRIPKFRDVSLAPVPGSSAFLYLEVRRLQEYELLGITSDDEEALAPSQKLWLAKLKTLYRPKSAPVPAQENPQKVARSETQRSLRQEQRDQVAKSELDRGVCVSIDELHATL